jgi:hypothetical protein
MKDLTGAAVLLAVILVLSACVGGHAVSAAMSGPKAADSRVVVLRGHRLRAPLLKRIVVLARKTARSLGDTSVKTARVYGPDSRYALVKASSGDLVQKTADGRKRFYLIVLRGHFVCDSCSGPAGAKPPRGTIATAVWSGTAGGTDFGLTRRLPATMSRLGSPTVIGSRAG